MDGVFFNLMIIFEGKLIQKSWAKFYPEATFATSAKGWTDDELGTF